MLPCRIVADHIGCVLFLEIGNSVESHIIPKLLTVGAMAALDLAIKRGVSRIDEIMDKTVPFACNVEPMEPRRQQIGTLPVSSVVVRENASAVSLEANNFECRFLKKFLKKDD